jgi:hypothetical protein
VERTQPRQIRPLPRQHHPARRHKIGNRDRRLQTLKLRLANPRHPAPTKIFLIKHERLIL